MASVLARPRRLIAAAALAGLVLRLAFALLYWVDKPLTHDEREYLALAQSVAAGRGFVYAASHETGTAQQFGRAPAYPLFLAMIGAGTGAPGSTPVRVKIAQSFVGAVGVWLIGLIALRAAGPRPAVIAAAIAAVYPPLVWIPAYVLSEAVYSVLALGTVLLLDIAVDHADDAGSGRAGGALALIAGMLAGVAVLTRPAMIFFLPLAAVWLVARRRTVLAVALIAAAAAVIAPWTARNARVYGRFVLVASEGGVTFWTGNHPLAVGEGDLAANPAIKRAEIAFRAAHPGLTAEELEPLYYRDAINHIRAHPGWWFGLLARKAFYTVVPIGPSYTLHSTKYLVASLVPYLLLLPFAVAGSRVLLRGRRRPVALLLLAASSVLVCLVFFPQERFRIPVIDPALIVCAAAAAPRRPHSS
jgi:4-amino-4-deoxy-L-arabinose transferase-like glycosyltransferase